jgi:hypothetical protein
VLSELLQNADDARATEASVGIADGSFQFTHNGEDFRPDHFRSLCNFGFSNKRALHTIGFRGIGFKSTFSLGDRVELVTPTLSVAFNSNRFTEPVWVAPPDEPQRRTTIRVQLSDANVQKAIESSLQLWLQNPVSLLFFRHLRKLTVHDSPLSWEETGNGPLPGSEWMCLDGDLATKCLLVRSDAQTFPVDALDEIRQERLVGDSDNVEFPPVTVELVLGAEGRLYVVLPTEVSTSLPFAANAPFLQDPARIKLKDPALSPTNRWLLERIGDLAASAMMFWLETKDLILAERARAYELLPPTETREATLEGTCTNAIVSAFKSRVRGERLLLTSSGELVEPLLAAVYPDALFDIWPIEEVTSRLDDKERHALAREVTPAGRQRLGEHKLAESLTAKDLVQKLQSVSMPRPDGLTHIQKLWSFVATNGKDYFGSFGSVPKTVRIVPVQGQSELYSADEATRLGAKWDLKSVNDYTLLKPHLRTVDAVWIKHVEELRQEVKQKGTDGVSAERRVVLELLDHLGLSTATPADQIIDQVAGRLFRERDIPISKVVQFAHIAAHLGVRAGPGFRFVTRDGRLRSKDSPVFVDLTGDLDILLPPDHRDSQLLHPDYWGAYESCTHDEWQSWLSSGGCGLQTYPSPTKCRTTFWSRDRLELALRQKGFSDSLTYVYSGNHLEMEDWDYDKLYWQHWTQVARDNEELWGLVGKHILNKAKEIVAQTEKIIVKQVSQQKTKREILSERLLPAWILKLREYPCLHDTKGFLRQPDELLLRTRETEAFIDVAPFIDRQYDTEDTRKLLEMLGVQTAPPSPAKLVDRIRALSETSTPPLSEVEKYYRRLDQSTESCSGADLVAVRQDFVDHPLIYSESGTWNRLSEVFRKPDEEAMPGAEVVRASVRDLRLWERIGVGEYPTVELALEWLRERPEGQRLSQSDARRARAIMRRHHGRVWTEVGHWISLAGHWTPVGALKYAYSDGSSLAQENLHQKIKQLTADFRMLSRAVVEDPPFSALADLSTRIEHRFPSPPEPAAPASMPEWLTALGSEIQRIKVKEPSDEKRIRHIAKRLATTTLQSVKSLKVIPYLDGEPAGTPEERSVLWSETTLYATVRPMASLIPDIAGELNRVFRAPELRDAINFCIDRNAQFVSDLIREHFDIAPDVPEAPPEPAQAPEPSGAKPAPPAGPIVVAPPSPPPGEPSEPLAVAPPPPKPPAPSGGGTPAPTPAPTPPLMQRFLEGIGFTQDGNGRYRHSDGSSVAKPHSAAFWQRQDAQGKYVHSYWPLDHCLETKPLEVPAEVWNAVSERPDAYSIVLKNTEGLPAEYPGELLQRLKEERKIGIYPAAYRLKYEDSDEA